MVCFFSVVSVSLCIPTETWYVSNFYQMIIVKTFLVIVLKICASEIQVLAEIATFMLTLLFSIVGKLDWNLA